MTQKCQDLQKSVKLLFLFIFLFLEPRLQVMIPMRLSCSGCISGVAFSPVGYRAHACQAAADLLCSRAVIPYLFSEDRRKEAAARRRKPNADRSVLAHLSGRILE